MKKIMMGFFISILLLISGLGAASTVFYQEQQGADSNTIILANLDPAKKSQELDMMGLVNTRVISKGRYGRTREISLSVPKSTEANIKKMLEEGLGLF